jgi:hypothetical protein
MNLEDFRYTRIQKHAQSLLTFLHVVNAIRVVINFI